MSGAASVTRQIEICLSILLLTVSGCVLAATASNREAYTINNEGVKAINQGNCLLAIQRLEEALKADPSYDLARHNLAIAYNNYGLQLQVHPEKSIKQFHRAVYLDPNNVSTRGNLDTIITMLKKNPRLFEDRIALGDEASKSGDFVGAIVEYQSAVNIKDDAGIRKKLETARIQNKWHPLKTTIEKDLVAGAKDADTSPELRQKIIKLLEKASKKGAGTKSYESVLASIDHDIAAGSPPDQINKRLASLAHSIESQLNEIAAFRLGASDAFVSPAQAKEWGPYATYMTAVQSKIKDRWRPPQESRSHSMTILFKISKNGQVSNLKIDKSSGVLKLDESILKAAEAASPFAPLPSFCKEKDIDIQFTFDYNSWGYTKSSTAKTTSNSSVTSPAKTSNSFDMNTFVYVVGGGVSVGNVSPAFLEEVKHYVAAVPQKLLIELQNRGARLCVTPRLVDKYPGYNYDKPRGWDDGMTGKNVDGLFDGTDAIVCEYWANYNDDTKLEKNNRVGHTVRHELGHAFDHYWHRISNAGEFKDTYMQEVAHMDPDQRDGELAYFTQKAQAGPSECFAELFGVIIGGEVSNKLDTALKQCFPKCTQLIRQKLEI